MKKKMTLLALGASLIAIPALAAPMGAKMDPNAEWTRAQAEAQATERFAKMDANKDGKFDAADRTAMRAQREGARFAALDANKDGSVSRAEFDQANAERMAKAQERRAQFASKRAEAGTTGEAKRGGRSKGHDMHRGGGMRGGWGMGPNANQSMTQAQFVAKSLERFDAMDGNKDGKVTAAERTAAREANRAARSAAREARAAAK